MRVRNWWVVKLLAIGMCLALPATAVMAQEEKAQGEKKEERPIQEREGPQEETKPIPLAEMTVTATKTRVNIADAPASVSVVTAEQIEKKNVSRIGDALKGVPGIYLRGNAFGDIAPTGDTIFGMRGVPFTNRSLFLLDGQPLNTPNVGFVRFSNIFMQDVERIEVVPGPFSALYGGNAIGGVINVITREPREREITLRGGFTGGDLNTGVGTFSYRDRFANGLGISLGGEYLDSSGHIGEFVVRTATPGAGSIPVTGWERTTDTFGNPAFLLGDRGRKPSWQGSGQLKLFYDLTPATKLSAGFTYHEIESGFTRFHTNLRDASGNPVASGSITINDNGAKRITLRETDFVFGAPIQGEKTIRSFGAFEHKLGTDIVLKADIAVHNVSSFFTSFGPTATFHGGRGQLFDIPVNDRIDGSLGITFPLFKRHRVTAGFAANHNKLERARHTLTNWRDEDSKTAVEFRTEGFSNIFSIYAQDEIAVLDNLSLFLGGRFDYWETKGKLVQFVAPAASREFPHRSLTEFSPKGALVFKPLEGLSLKASIGRAFRPPTLNDLYGGGFSPRGGGGIIIREPAPDLGSETAFSWEVGGLWSLTTGTTLTATYFETDLKDIIFIKTEIEGLTEFRRSANAALAKIRGVEAGVTQKLWGFLELYGNVTFHDTEMVENDADPLSVGKRLTFVPELMYNVGLLGERGPWFGSVNMRYVGKVFSDNRNRDIAKGVFGANADPHTVVDLKLGYRPTKWLKASFSVNNVLNEEYFTFFKAPGRTFTGELVLAL